MCVCVFTTLNSCAYIVQTCTDLCEDICMRLLSAPQVPEMEHE